MEFDLCACFPQVINSKLVLFVFNTDTHPDVISPLKVGTQFCNSFGAFGEHLELMPVCPFHYIKDFLDKLKGDIFMEKIAHGIDKNNLRLFPFKRFFNRIFMHGEFEAISIICLPHCLQAKSHSFSIAVFTTRTDLCTASERIPCRFCPLDSRMFSHASLL